MKTLVAVLSVAIVSMLPATSMGNESEEVRQRVMKVGRLNVGGEVPAPAAAAGATETNTTETASAAPADPAAMYQASCFACHGTGAAGAPILGDSAAWAPRIAQGEATLFEHVTNGLNAMPPRGASTFSDDELKTIITYMVESAQ